MLFITILFIISLFIFGFYFVSCNKIKNEGIIVNHKEGKHHAKINDKNRIFFRSKPHSILLKFDTSCRYELDTGQTSWNKIYGTGEMTWKYIDGSYKRKRETMLVWRYNKNTDKIEIAQYERQDYDILPEIIIGDLDFNEEGIYNLGFLKSGSKTGPYFGGKLPAPHDMSYLIKFIY